MVGRSKVAVSTSGAHVRIAGANSRERARPSRLREGLGVMVAAVGAYVLVSLLSHHPLDPSFNASLRSAEVQNAGGIVGAYLSDLLVQMLGLGAFVVVVLLFATGGRLAFGKALGVKRDQTFAYLAAIASAAILLQIGLGVVPIGGRPAAAGGLVGRVSGDFLVHWVELTGAALFAASALVLALTVITGGSVSVLLTRAAAFARTVIGAARERWAAYLSARANAAAARKSTAAEARFQADHASVAKLARPARRSKVAEKSGVPRGSAGRASPWADADDGDGDGSDELVDAIEPARLLDIVRKGAAEDKAEQGIGDGPKIVAPVVYKPKAKAEKSATKALEVPTPEAGSYVLPDLSLLESEDQKPLSIDSDALKAAAEVLERKLKDFGVFGRVVEVHPGPVITMFEFEPAPGIKVNRVANLVDDLKMAMKATSVRIVAPIPGKGTVGIEIPNEQRETVFLKDILGHTEYSNKATMTPIALGKDIGGKPIVADMSKMPHLLVAGTTGSGKSVSVNSMIMSILHRATPNDVRLLMIDPKMLEFSIYDGIPHLLLPVITNPKKAAMALKWAVTEMERRYRLLADVNARNIAAYNKRIPRILEDRNRQEVDQSTRNDPMDGAPSAQAIAEEENRPLDHGHLPYIVIVIDELADLMLVAKNDVEESITRLAQMARAAGIHLLIATQRPSVDVITGLIKANFPARIAFRVFSKIDSRTVLDSGGAETLLGDGDMLYLPPGTARLTRVHGAFVSDTEIQRVVDFLKAQGKPRYEEEILRTPVGGNGEGGESDEDHDEYYDQAIAIVAETRQASISFLQRKLKVGYNRAARMIERMEQEGIVGASDGVKPRPVLVQQIPPA